MARQLIVELIGKSDRLTKTLDDATKSTSSWQDKVSSASLKAGAAITGAGLLLNKMGDDMGDAQDKLQAVIENSGKSFDDYSKQINSSVKQMQHFGFGTTDTNEALAKLTARLGDPAKALENMGVVADVAKFKNISLAEAADLVGKAADGNAKVLKQFGITVNDVGKAQEIADKGAKDLADAQDKLSAATQKLSDLKAIQATKDKLSVQDQIALRNAQDAVSDAQKKAADAATYNANAQKGLKAFTDNTKDGLAQLGDKLKGIAEGDANDFNGKIAEAKAKIFDFAATIGQKVGPALTVMGPALAGVGQTINGVTSITKGLSATMTFLAANPIVLVIAAIAALVAGFVIAYQKSETFRNIVDGAVRAVGDGAIWVRDRFVDLWNFIRDLPGKIKSAAGSIASSVTSMIPGSGLIGSIVGHLPHFANGGVVQGPLGAPQLAMVHGGERITPFRGGQNGGNGGTTIVVNVSGSVIAERDLGRVVADAIRDNGIYGVS